MLLMLLVYVTACLLISSKFLDCYTTVKYVRHAGRERNRIIRPFMRRYGMKATIWAVFVLVVVITLLSVWMLHTVFDHWAWKVMFVVVGLVDSAFQFAVAHTNWSGRLNGLVKLVLGIRVYR